ncbi:MAG: DUF4160 domain-containing protein [Bacteroidota bacterium]|nr:DUF4160 domain-containing protein [Bacteroidota bacterium]
MPKISNFFGIIISMFYDDHNPPHFHAKYGEYNAQISILELNLIEGNLPPRVLGLVIEWAIIHKEELILNWERMLNNETLKNIEPLE